MFQVSRFDPRDFDQQEDQEQKPSKRDKKRKRRDKKIKTKSSDITPTQKEEVKQKVKSEVKQESVNNVDEKMSNHEVGDDTTTSISKVSSETNIETTKERKGLLKVIAPEQKPNPFDTGELILDEQMDDFDVGAAIKGERDHLNDDDFVEGGNDKKEQEENKVFQNAVYISSLPMERVAGKEYWNLSPFLIQNLQNNDCVKNFFPIQSIVISHLLFSSHSINGRPRDICVSSPTGSGKTLCYVLPVLNSLYKSSLETKVKRVRALCVLPTRDLAMQVFRVFEQYCHGSHLKVGLAIGSGGGGTNSDHTTATAGGGTDFKTEQKNLILEQDKFKSFQVHDTHLISYFLNNSSNTGVGVSSNKKYNKNDIYSAIASYEPSFLSRTNSDDKNTMAHDRVMPRGGMSAVDIIVCTPGRLLDHIDKTPGFTLQHLQYLIIDEADRLLTQNYQNWISKISKAVSSDNYQGSKNSNSDSESTNTGMYYFIDPTTRRKESKMKSILDRPGSNYNNSKNDHENCRNAIPLQKLLFSATLTKDPQKLSALGLIHPVFYDAHTLKTMQQKHQEQKQEYSSSETYLLPEGLSEYIMEAKTKQHKPLLLLGILLQELSSSTATNEKMVGNNKTVVVFTSSLDTTHRLTRLLQILWVSAKYGDPFEIAEFSSALSQKQRTRLLNSIRDHQNNNNSSKKNNNTRVQVIVCSDGMSRGMDIPNVSAVINYDIPPYAKTYIHRCGRTARANRTGKAISILMNTGGSNKNNKQQQQQSPQMKQFYKMRNLISPSPKNKDSIKIVGLKKTRLFDRAIPIYQKSLQRLREIIQTEKQHSSSTTTISAPDLDITFISSKTNRVKDEDIKNEYHSDSSSSVPSWTTSSKSSSDDDEEESDFD